MATKGIKDVLVCVVFGEGFDSVVRSCLSADTDMRPSSDAVRTALENHTQSHTHMSTQTHNCFL